MNPSRQVAVEVEDFIETWRWQIRRSQNVNRNNKIKDVVKRAKRPMKKEQVEAEDLKG